MSDHFDLPFPHYRCLTCGKDLPLGEARLAVACSTHRDPAEPFDVRLASDDDRSAIETICDRAIGETVTDAFGRTFDVMSAANFVAESGGELVGLLSLTVALGEATIAFLSVYPEHQSGGVASGLLDAARAHAAERGFAFMRVAVTNDDLPLLYFYQRHGFSIYEVAVGEVADRFGAATPGFASIAVRDEIRLRRSVGE